MAVQFDSAGLAKSGKVASFQVAMHRFESDIPLHPIAEVSRDSTGTETF